MYMYSVLRDGDGEFGICKCNSVLRDNGEFGICTSVLRDEGEFGICNSVLRDEIWRTVER